MQTNQDTKLGSILELVQLIQKSQGSINIGGKDYKLDVNFDQELKRLNQKPDSLPPKPIIKPNIQVSMPKPVIQIKPNIAVPKIQIQVSGAKPNKPVMPKAAINLNLGNTVQPPVEKQDSRSAQPMYTDMFSQFNQQKPLQATGTKTTSGTEYKKRREAPKKQGSTNEVEGDSIFSKSKSLALFEDLTAMGKGKSEILGKKQSQQQRQISKYQREKSQLAEELKAKEQHIKVLQGTDDTALHIAFMFASPLVREYQKRAGTPASYQAVPQLDYEKEYSMIIKAADRAEKQVKLQKEVATWSHFQEVLGKYPRALHFSGHGMLNNEQTMGPDYKNFAQEGDYLWFEDQEGACHNVSKRMLRKNIQTFKNLRFDFVFVATCHSEFAGRIFLESGASHVVCIKQDQEILDDSTIVFTETFYQQIFQGHEVCEAFNRAKQRVINEEFGKGEAERFLLLLYERDQRDMIIQDEEEQVHKCVKLHLLDGKPVELHKATHDFEIPAKVKNYIGRQTEMYHVVKTLKQERLVTLTGIMGIGKSSLVKNALNFMVDRHHFFDGGIFYMQLRGIKEIEIFQKQILVQFMMRKSVMKSNVFKDVNNLSLDSLMEKVWIFLKKKQHQKFLVCLDNIDDLKKADTQNLSDFFNQLLSGYNNLFLLVTSRTKLGMVRDIKEEQLVTKPLSNTQIVELFIKFAPFELKHENWMELFIAKQQDESKDKNKAPIQQQVTSLSNTSEQLKKPETKIKTLAKHQFFQQLMGNPQNTTFLACMLSSKVSLIDLVEKVSNDKIMQEMEEENIADIEFATVQVMLKNHIQMLKEQDERSLNLLFMLAHLPGGVIGFEVSQLYESYAPDTENDQVWIQCINTLQKHSLIEVKKSEYFQQITKSVKLLQEQKGIDIDVNSHQYTQNFQVAQVLTQYLQELIDEESRVIILIAICQYYKNILEAIYTGLTGKGKYTFEDDTAIVLQFINRHEKNILFCIECLHKAGNQSNNSSDPLENDQQNELMTNLRRIQTRNFDSEKQSQDNSDIGSSSSSNDDPDVVLKIKVKHELTDIPEDEHEGSRRGTITTNQVEPTPQRLDLGIDSDSSGLGSIVDDDSEEEEESSSDLGSDQSAMEDAEVVHQLKVNVEDKDSGAKFVSDPANKSPKNTKVNPFLDNNEKQEKAQNKKRRQTIANLKMNMPIKSEASSSNISFKDLRGSMIVRKQTVHWKEMNYDQQQQRLEEMDQQQFNIKHKMRLSSKIKKIEKSSSQVAQNVEQLSIPGQMVLYYICNAFNFKEFGFGFKLCKINYTNVAKTKLFKGNLRRLEALFIEKRYKLGYAQTSESLTQILNCLKQAELVFGLQDQICNRGLGLTWYQLGTVYQKYAKELSQKAMDKEYYIEEARIHFKKAIKCFQTINHLIGLHLSNQRLQELECRLEDISHRRKESIKYLNMYNEYKFKEQSSYIERAKGHHDSLLIEIAKTTQDEIVFPKEETEKKESILQLPNLAHRVSIGLFKGNSQISSKSLAQKAESYRSYENNN